MAKVQTSKPSADIQEIYAILLAEAIRGFFRRADISSNEDVSGQLVGHEFQKLGGKDDEVYYWIRNWLLKEGWEPFAVTDFRILHLREEIGQESEETA